VPDDRTIATFQGRPQAHESAHLHVSGQATYIDDMALPANTLHAALGMSSVAHARIRSMDLTAVAAAPGVVAVVAAGDVPGKNNYGPIHDDDPIFAPGLVQYAGQSLFAVAATSYDAARRAARLARVDYEVLPALLDIPAALAVIPRECWRARRIGCRAGSPSAGRTISTSRARSAPPCRAKTAPC
jgi:xanthine dehydrogenase large subunit